MSDNNKLARRPVALVTGGQRGIGAAIVRRLAQDGFDVAFTCRTPEDIAHELCAEIEMQGGRGLVLASDLQDLDAHAELVENVVAWGGGLDCLINNAGIGSPSRGDLLDMQPSAFNLVIDTNLRGTFFLTQAVARRMLQLPSVHHRSIVNVSSVSVEMASPERGEYCMSKAGLGMATKLFALRLATEGIGVFEVRPGVIKTDMTAGVAEKYERRFQEGLVPMQRWGETSDIASIVSALASGQFGFATGTVIHADGGLAIPRL
ncbi:3-ketoacyl-ACP reductase [Pseudomonas monteilii]|uniref:3-ketoacyl-ACP reductase n=1 Tax=Pseudomonas monteilii TaxID=76759 RepID=UPI003D08881D